MGWNPILQTNSDHVGTFISIYNIHYIYIYIYIYMCVCLCLLVF